MRRTSNLRPRCRWLGQKLAAFGVILRKVPSASHAPVATLPGHRSEPALPQDEIYRAALPQPPEIAPTTTQPGHRREQAVWFGQVTSRGSAPATRNWRPRLAILLCLASLAAVLLQGVAIAQRGWRRQRYFDPSQVDRGDVPNWENSQEFKNDVFTFVRVKYSSGGGGWYGGGRWATDYPASDLNFSYRLHELTALEVDPNGKILELSDDAIFDYPFLYLLEPGNMMLMEDEVAGLRRYLLNGGFLMVDDFWGEAQWAHFYQQLKRVFPEREPVELPLEHEIFHCVYDLKQKPQIPSIHAWLSGHTTESWDAREPHYRGVFDDDGRMMAIICHNTDLGDGWEREGESADYFREMSERWAYPLGINIVTYAMTH